MQSLRTRFTRWKQERRTPRVNRIIRTLILSDLFLLSGLGLFSPIFAVFVLENVDHNLQVVGASVSVYWIMRVVTVIPMSALMDKLDGDRDEYAFMILGTFLISSLPLGYLLASHAWHVYLLQAINGFAHAIAVPAWRVIFTRNIDAGAVGYEWSLSDASVGVATAASALVGTFIVSAFGFHALFFLMFAFGLVATGLLLSIYRHRRSSAWTRLRTHRTRTRRFTLS